MWCFAAFQPSAPLNTECQVRILGRGCDTARAAPENCHQYCVSLRDTELRGRFVFWMEGIMKLPRLRTTLAGITAVAIVSAVVHAKSGRPWYDDQGLLEIGLDGYCPVTLDEEERWQKGDGRFASRYEGRTYLFTNASAKARFDRQPELFAPVAAGLDVVMLIDANRRVPGQRSHGLWCRGRVYLFASEESLQAFCNRMDYYLANCPGGAGNPILR